MPLSPGKTALLHYWMTNMRGGENVLAEIAGIVPLEAQSAGTPVIALGIGGALDTVVPGKTGIFFDHPETDSLAEAILEFEKITINSENCRLNAQKFTPAIFRKEFVEKAGLSRMG